MRKTVIAATPVKKEDLYIVGLRAAGKSSYWKNMLEKDPSVADKYREQLMPFCASTGENAEFGLEEDENGTSSRFSLKKNAKLIAEDFLKEGYGQHIKSSSKVIFVKVDPAKYRTHKKYRNAVKYAINGGDYSFKDKSTKAIKEYMDNDGCGLSDEDFVTWIKLLQDSVLKELKALGVKTLVVDTVHVTSVKDVINFWKNSKYSDFIED
jgi:hypothetical protein